ncbi:MAG TPA: GNAT family N-acetyltransferase [Chitinophagaceae bacterium]|nr:GNAT family N-acetyltransferase [Chitinophagaceae bacterium]
MNNKLKILKATERDIPLIRELCFKIWPQTYASILSQDRIDYMLDYMYSSSSLQKQMNNGSQFIFVYDNEEPVGFAAYLSKGHGTYKLDKIYILPSQQGKGTGKFVIDYVIDEIKKLGATALQLQVNRNNKAKGFYEKLGFIVIDYQEFDIGHGHVMDDFVMEKKLESC